MRGLLRSRGLYGLGLTIMGGGEKGSSQERFSFITPAIVPPLCAAELPGLRLAPPPTPRWPGRKQIGRNDRKAAASRTGIHIATARSDRLSWCGVMPQRTDALHQRGFHTLSGICFSGAARPSPDIFPPWVMEPRCDGSTGQKASGDGGARRPLVGEFAHAAGFRQRGVSVAGASIPRVFIRAPVDLCYGSGVFWCGRARVAFFSFFFFFLWEKKSRCGPVIFDLPGTKLIVGAGRGARAALEAENMERVFLGASPGEETRGDLTAGGRRCSWSRGKGQDRPTFARFLLEADCTGRPLGGPPPLARGPALPGHGPGGTLI